MASGMKQYHITEKAVQETFVSDFPNVALLDPASLCSEVQRLTEELALSNARVSTLEAENKTLKLKLKQKKNAETNYSKHLFKYYKEFPDLYDLCEEMGALTHQSKQSKRDLERSFVGDTICQVGTIPSWTIHTTSAESRWTSKLAANRNVKQKIPVPRVEDFPVMPCEFTGFTLKPDGFVSGNPAIDLPSDTNQKSKLDSGCCS
jgi:hypothetical protein